MSGYATYTFDDALAWTWDCNECGASWSGFKSESEASQAAQSHLKEQHPEPRAPKTHKEAVRNVMRAYPGTQIFERGPHNVPELMEKLWPPRRKRRSKAAK